MSKRVTALDVALADRASMSAEEFVVLKLKALNGEYKAYFGEPYWPVRAFKKALADAASWNDYNAILDRVEADYRAWGHF